MEMWRDIPGYLNYQASNMGRIKNIKRNEVLESKPHRTVGGYEYLYLSGRGKPRNSFVHRLVALAFIGRCPDGMQVSHINEDRTDNRSDNLCYETPKQNSSRRLRRKRVSIGRGVGVSGYKGVSQQKGRKNWHARVMSGKIFHDAGVHKTPEDAARAYDRKVLEVRGCDAVTNESLGLL
jgi:hypothetical protein